MCGSKGWFIQNKTTTLPQMYGFFFSQVQHREHGWNGLPVEPIPRTSSDEWEASFFERDNEPIGRGRRVFPPPPIFCVSHFITFLWRGVRRFAWPAAANGSSLYRAMRLSASLRPAEGLLSSMQQQFRMDEDAKFFIHPGSTNDFLLDLEYFGLTMARITEICWIWLPMYSSTGAFGLFSY